MGRIFCWIILDYRDDGSLWDMIDKYNKKYSIFNLKCLNKYSILKQVSHHPTLIACHCEGRGWKFWGDSNLRSKFCGTSIQLDPVGILSVEFDDGEVFQWSKVHKLLYIE